MKLSYVIGVHNELTEMTELLDFLLPRIDAEDEILIQCDSDSVTDAVKQFVTIQEKLHESIRVIEFPLNKDFASFKNNMIKESKGDYVFNLDPDETPHEYLLYYIKEILESNSVDVIYIPRWNEVKGLTTSDIQKWRWKVDYKNRVNFPDYQMRIFKNTDEIEWKNKVHETITGFNTFSNLPAEEQWCLYHIKDISRQRQQNDFYETI